MDSPKFRVEFPLRAHPLLESDVLIVELAQKAQLVYRIVQKSSVKRIVLVRLEGFVLALHFARKVEFSSNVVVSLEQLKNGV